MELAMEVDIEGNSDMMNAVNGSLFNETYNSAGSYLGDDCISNLTTAVANSLNSSWIEDLCPPSNESLKYKDPSYYAIPYRIIGTIFQGIILLVGVFGNVMVVIVVVRTRSMKTPTNCYLVSLSLADLMVLIASIPNEILAYYLLGDEWVWGRIGCAVFIFTQYLGINASSLSITAFTIERYIAICHPMKAQKVCTVSRAKKIILGVWTFAFIYCSPWLFLTTTAPMYYKGHTDIETCTYALSRQYYWGYFFADLVLFYIFPLALSVILYGLIARILFSASSLTKNCGKKAPKKSNGHASGAQLNAKKSSNHSSDHSTRVQVVKMLAVVVAVFATLWLPYRALLVYNSFADHRYMELWYLMFCKTMIFVNSAINPILYNALSVKFRRAFKRMLCCDRAGKRQRIMRGGGGGPGGGAPFTSVQVSHNSLKHSTVTTGTVKTSCNREQFQHDL